MYIPAHFSAPDQSAAQQLMDEHPFATVITRRGDRQMISHLPLLLDGDVLLGHLARANPHAELLDGGHSTAIFHGPHAYVSPHWYAAGAQPVPTWNYAAVHVSGATVSLDAQRSDAILEALTRKMESVALPAMSAADRAAKLRAIVGFEIRIEQLAAKFKMSQNRRPQDRRGVIAGLLAQQDSGARGVAQWMTAHE